MRDTLLIDSQYATSVPEIYNRYNGKTYSVNSENLKFYVSEKSNNEVSFSFEDLSSDTLTPSFVIVIKNTDFSSLLPEYNLADTAHIRVYWYQLFANNTKSYGTNGNVKSGVLKISHNDKYNTVSGAINNLKVPIDYYTPDNPLPNRILPWILILEGGSTRTVSLQYEFVRTNE